ncbi:hypothetical protein BsWGS_29208 [Bradybaena similaris]
MQVLVVMRGHIVWPHGTHYWETVAAEVARPGPGTKLTKTLEHLFVVWPTSEWGLCLTNALRINYASPQMSSSSSSIALLTGSSAWRGERKLCNTVPVEMVLWYRVGRKVSTPSLNSTDVM